MIPKEKGSEQPIYIFINQDSGQHQGSFLLEMGLNKFSLDNEVEIIFCDISDPEILNQCVELLKEIDQEIKIVIGGGDGTISRIVNSIVTNGIKLERVNFGCIPFGMNNQISECLGWGSHIHLSQDPGFIQRLTQQWIHAKQDVFDLWEIEIQTSENGYFRYFDHFGKKIYRIGETQLTRQMLNFFCIGQEENQNSRKKDKDSIMKQVNTYIKSNFTKQFLEEYNLEGIIENIIDDKKVEKKKDFKQVETKKKFLLSKTIELGNHVQFSEFMTLSLQNLNNCLQKDKPSSNKVSAESKNFQNGILEFFMHTGRATQNFSKLQHEKKFQYLKGDGPFTINFKEIAYSKSVYFQIDGDKYQVFSPVSIKIRKQKPLRVLINQTKN